MNLKTFKLVDLQPADYNPRTITPEALEGLTKSLQKFGYLSPLVVNLHGGKQTVISGHQRLKAMLDQGVEEAQCVVVDFDPVTEKAANIALNSETISGDWELEGLEKILQDLSFEFPEFDELNLDRLTSDLHLDSEILVKDNKEIDVDDFGNDLAHTCPKCGFEFDD